MKIYFDHEKLQAYQASLEFVRWSESLFKNSPRTGAVYSQLDRARTSIPLNIAEGNAKFTPSDKCKYFDIAHGSAVECSACLDVLFIQEGLTNTELDKGKELLSEIVGLMIGLIKSKLPDRFREDQVEYRIEETGASKTGSMSLSERLG